MMWAHQQGCSWTCLLLLPEQQKYANPPQAKPVNDNKLVEVGGGGDCFYASMSDQIFCDGGEQKNHLRAATAQYLLQNKATVQKEFMVLDDEEPMSVEVYASRVALTGGYAGNFEIAIMARLT